MLVRHSALMLSSGAASHTQSQDLMTDPLTTVLRPLLLVMDIPDTICATNYWHSNRDEPDHIETGMSDSSFNGEVLPRSVTQPVLGHLSIILWSVVSITKKKH